MFTTYAVVTALCATALTFSATLDFIRYDEVLTKMEQAGVPFSWLNLIGAAKAAGALGVVIGIAVPWIGTAAATGVVLFFVCAIITHLRVHDYGFGLAVVFGSLGVATLALGLASS
jgi:hypothetical protein